MTHDIFLSCSKSDRSLADALCHHLEEIGIRCWIAPRNVSLGEDWTGAIAGAIQDCSGMVMLYSSGSLESRHVKSEVRAAFDHGRVIIPVRLSDIMPTGGFDHLLGSSHWIDAFPKSLSHWVTPRDPNRFGSSTSLPWRYGHFTPRKKKARWAEMKIGNCC